MDIYYQRAAADSNSCRYFADAQHGACLRAEAGSVIEEVQRFGGWRDGPGADQCCQGLQSAVDANLAAFWATFGRAEGSAMQQPPLCCGNESAFSIRCREYPGQLTVRLVSSLKMIM